MQSTNPIINQLKDLALQKGQVAKFPQNGVMAVIIKEHTMTKNGVTSSNIEIGVGKVVAMGKFFDVIGFAKHGDQFPLQESSVRTTLDEIKAPKEGAEVLVATFPITLMRKIDEARWDGKMQDLPDLVNFLENLK